MTKYSPKIATNSDPVYRSSESTFSAKKGAILELVLRNQELWEIVSQETSSVEVDLKHINHQKIFCRRGKMVSNEFEPSSSFWVWTLVLQE